MFYVTCRQSPRHKQMTLEEFLFGEDVQPQSVNFNVSNTVTYQVKYINQKLVTSFNTQHAMKSIRDFLAATKDLRSQPRENLYETFYIPKKSGGLRRIDAPKQELMSSLRTLKHILEDELGLLYHTSAFAYVKNRSTIDAVKRHQENESKWFGKFDLSNFFGSTTLDFVMNMMSMIYPVCLIVEDEKCKSEFREALDLAFLNGGLPQGTPVSPIITNVMMIPIDFEISNTLRDFNNQRYVYTRYADDFLVSSKYTFKVSEIQKLIVDTLAKYGAPFTLNAKKTRYGSSSGSNWNLGVMLNKDNQITVGHKKKRQFQAMLASYAMDKIHGKQWDRTDIQVMDGYRAYYKMVEGDAIDRIVTHVGKKLGVDIMKMIKEDLRV